MSGSTVERYRDARWDSMLMPTLTLRAMDRECRCRSSRGEHLGQATLAMWIAARAELSRRGVRVPATDRPPRRPWSPRWWLYQRDLRRYRRGR